MHCSNGIINGTIGKTLNDIGIPLVPLGNPERTRYHLFRNRSATGMVAYYYMLQGFATDANERHWSIICCIIFSLS